MNSSKAEWKSETNYSNLLYAAGLGSIFQSLSSSSKHVLLHLGCTFNGAAYANKSRSQAL